jgi:iron complex transport system substrate-binding protein
MNRSSRLLAATLGIALTVSIAACGDDDSDNGSTTGASASGASSESATAAEGYYPHTQTTAHGDTTIKAQPERIVALSPTTTDEMLALGVTPIAVGTDPAQLDVNAPWIADNIRDISDADLVSPTLDINVEALANENADLIIGTSYQFKDKSLWDKVNAIAPTPIPESPDTNVGWEASLRTTAEALGLQDKAEEVIDNVKQKYKDAAGDVPAGKTYNFTGYGDNGFFSGNGSVFQMFGLKPSSTQDDTQNGAALSIENADKLTGDLLVVWPYPADKKADLDKNSTFQELPAVKNGTVYYPDQSDATAINAAGPNSLLWFLDRITPTVQKLK